MAGAENENCAPSASQDLALDDIGRMSVARSRDPLPGRSIVNEAPVDSGIGEHDSEAALGAASAIHVADGRNQPLVHRRVPDENVDRVPPYLGERMLPYRCAGDVTVNPILVARIAKLDDEVAAR